MCNRLMFMQNGPIGNFCVLKGINQTDSVLFGTLIYQNNTLILQPKNIFRLLVIMRKKVLIVLLVSMVMGSADALAQTTRLSLDSLRSLAIAGNKNLRMGDMRVTAAGDERRAAFTKYLPRVNATGAYLHSSKEISLLSDEHKATLPALDDKLGGLGSKLVEDLHTDTRNMGTVAVMLTQPIYNDSSG